MAMAPAHTLNLTGVLSESKRIINTHSRHFLSLSLLFLLPLSSAILIFPTLYPPTTVQSSLNDTVSSNPTFIFPIIYTLTTYLLSIFALATITHSTHHGFYGRPVHFIAAIKSIPSSFIPIITTQLAAKFFICFLSIALLAFMFTIIKILEFANINVNIGTENDDYEWGSFVWVCGIVGVVVLSLIVLYIQVIWGLEPLWRSAYLTKGMRAVSLWLLLVFGVLIGVWVWMGINSVLDFSVVEDWRSWDFVMQTVISSGFLGVLTLLLLHYAAANTVLYMYCKALHGELAIEIAEEFAREYVSLPFDEAKVPHVVTVVSA